LMQVKGIGPKVALNVLSSLKPESLARVITSGDLNALQKVPGIGRKTSQRLILELQEKVKPFISSEAGDMKDLASESIEILMSLGCSLAEADEAVEAVFLEKDKPTSLNEIISKCLKLMSEKKI